MNTLRRWLRALIDGLSKLVRSTLITVQALYLIRFPVLTLLVIAALMPIMLWAAASLLANLYDLDSFLKTFWFSLSAFLLTFSALTALKLALLYGGDRVEFSSEIRESLDEKTKKYAGSKLFFLGACLLTVFLISGLIFRSRDHLWENLLGSVAGFAVAMFLLFFADILQRLLNRKSKAQILGGFLLPCNNPLAEWANRSEFLYRISYWMLRPKFADDMIRRIPPFLGRGYIKYQSDGKPEVDDDNRTFVYPEHVTSIALFMFFFAVYVIVGWTPAGFRETLQVTALSYLMLLLTVLVWGLSALAFFFDRYRLPVVFVLIPIYVLSSFTSEDYLFPVIDPGTTSVQTSLLTPAVVLLNPEADPAVEDYAIVVAANGGGIQAAAWTAKVLTGLEEQCQNGAFAPAVKSCASKIKLISGVSGGSVGAMYFLDAYTPDGIPKESLNRIVENAERSSLDAAAWGLVYPDFTRSFLPFFWSGYGRGHALEDEWAKGNDGLKKGLLSWREGVRAHWRPASIFNATVVETGERLLLSTSDICEKKNSVGECLAVGQLKSAEADLPTTEMDKKSFYSFIRRPDKDKDEDQNKDIAIKTAARLSASFPYVTPAPRAAMPRGTNSGHHVADGGYYDNYGISSLIEWLNEGLRYRDNLNLKHILIIQIRGDQIGEPEDAGKPSRRPYYQTLAPLYTLLNVRTTGQLSRNEAELDIFMRYWRSKHDPVNIQTVIFEFPREKGTEGPPLSWHLSLEQKREIAIGWGKILNGADSHDGWRKFGCFIKLRTQPAGQAQECRDE